MLNRGKLMMIWEKQFYSIHKRKLQKQFMSPCPQNVENSTPTVWNI